MHTIIYACDDNYAPLTAVSAVSALRFNPKARIVLLGLRLSDESVSLVRSRVESFGGEFVCHDVSSRIEAIAERGFNGYFSFAAYARIFIAELLRDFDGRVLYLDCDTLVRTSLDGLFAMDMRGRPFAFGYDCICHAYRRHVNVAPDAPYYNSGVMLADLRAWRSSGATEALRREFAAPGGPNPLGDQDMIVRAWRDFIVPLPPKWNFLSHFLLYDCGCVRRINGLAAPFATEAEYAEAQRERSICHFSGHTLGRPWYVSSCHPLRGEYVEAARLAGLDSVASQVRPMSLPYRVQAILWKTLPRPLFQPIARLMLRAKIRISYGV